MTFCYVKKISHSRRVICFLALLIVFSLAADGQNPSTESIGRFLQALNDLKSYDVIISVEMLDCSQAPATPGIMDVETNHDTFGIGLGRRFERNIRGQFQGIGVIDWKTATSQNKPLARTFNVVMPGLTYLDYVNPASPGDLFFLSEALEGKKISVHSIDNLASDSRMPAFQIENTNGEGSIREFSRIWLDPEHGYMLNKMEWYEQPPGSQPILMDRMQVEKFDKVDEDVWVPSKASMAHLSEGRIWTEYAMQLDEVHSSFNSVRSNALFQVSSLSGNYQKDGWTWEYPPALLSLLRASDATTEASATSDADINRLRKMRWIILGAMCLPTILFAVILKRNKEKEDLCQT